MRRRGQRQQLVLQQCVFTGIQGDAPVSHDLQGIMTVPRAPVRRVLFGLRGKRPGLKSSNVPCSGWIAGTRFVISSLPGWQRRPEQELLTWSNVCGLWSLRALFYLKVNSLPLDEGPPSFAGNCTRVHEHILAAFIR